MNDAIYNGTGWSFPPEFTTGGKELQMTSGINDIVNSLEIILGTRLNERIMKEEFGSSLSEFQFEMINTPMLSKLKHMISDAILYFEARIKLNLIDIDIDKEQEGLLLIRLDFILPTSNSRYNMVYPFYLTEGNF